jgi:hypothetical protein
MSLSLTHCSIFVIFWLTSILPIFGPLLFCCAWRHTLCPVLFLLSSLTKTLFLFLYINPRYLVDYP